MKTKIIMSIFSLITWFNYAQTPQEIHDKIGKLFQKEMKTKGVHHAQFQIHSDSLDIDWYYAVAAQKEYELLKEKPFYTASIGKMFTATSIAILKDQGKLSFDDPIAKYLDQNLIEGLHIIDGKDYGSEIKISQLLQHTSGLADYFEDAPKDEYPPLLEEILTNTNKFWEAEELIEYSKKHFKAHFKPGEGYHYTDTEYILLGMIVEKLSGMKLHEFFQQFIFRPINMKHTYLNLRSEALMPTQAMTPFYAESMELSGFKSLSADWAGGGIVSTTEDLIQFEKALFKGELLEKETFEEMQNWTDESRGTYYGFGLRKWKLRELFPTLPKIQMIGHSGSTASFLYYIPELDVYVSGSFNQTEHTKNSIVFLVKVLSQVQKLQEERKPN